MSRYLAGIYVGLVLGSLPAAAFGHDCRAGASAAPLGAGAFTRLDRNGDGAVVLAEAETAALALFDAMDDPRDGWVRLDEAERWARSERARHLQERFVRFDIDRDGVVRPAEMAGPRRGFARFDLNRDGAVTREELRLASLREKPLGHGRSWLSRFETWDSDGDGVVKRSEVQHEVRRLFRATDANHDGLLSRREVAGRRRAAP